MSVVRYVPTAPATGFDRLSPKLFARVLSFIGDEIPILQKVNGAWSSACVLLARAAMYDQRFADFFKIITGPTLLNVEELRKELNDQRVRERLAKTLPCGVEALLADAHIPEEAANIPFSFEFSNFLFRRAIAQKDIPAILAFSKSLLHNEDLFKEVLDSFSAYEELIQVWKTIIEEGAIEEESLVPYFEQFLDKNLINVYPGDLLGMALQHTFHNPQLRLINRPEFREAIFRGIPHLDVERLGEFLFECTNHLPSLELALRQPTMEGVDANHLKAIISQLLAPDGQERCHEKQQAAAVLLNHPLSDCISVDTLDKWIVTLISKEMWKSVLTILESRHLKRFSKENLKDLKWVYSRYKSDLKKFNPAQFAQLQNDLEAVGKILDPGICEIFKRIFA